MELLPARLIKRARAYDMPLGALTAITELRAHLATLEKNAIDDARAKGATWDDIASALGVTRQALQQRLGRKR
jgi:hypothetical protein